MPKQCRSGCNILALSTPKPLCRTPMLCSSSSLTCRGESVLASPQETHIGVLLRRMYNCRHACTNICVTLLPCAADLHLYSRNQFILHQYHGLLSHMQHLNNLAAFGQRHNRVLDWNIHCSNGVEVGSHYGEVVEMLRKKYHRNGSTDADETAISP